MSVVETKQDLSKSEIRLGLWSNAAKYHNVADML